MSTRQAGVPVTRRMPGRGGQGRLINNAKVVPTADLDRDEDSDRDRIDRKTVGSPPGVYAPGGAKSPGRAVDRTGGAGNRRRTARRPHGVGSSDQSTSSCEGGAPARSGLARQLGAFFSLFMVVLTWVGMAEVRAWRAV